MWGTEYEEFEARGVPAPRELLERLPDAVVLLDASARLIWGNPAAEQLFGIGLEAGIGRSGLDFIHPDDLQVAALSMATVRTKGVGSLLELRLRGAQGWRLVEVRGAPCGDDVVLVLRDLTDRRRWEVARDEVARFRTLTQYSSSLTILLDGDGVVTSSSGAVTRLLGVDQEWLEGRPFAELVAPGHRPLLAEVLGHRASAPEDGPLRRTLDVGLLSAAGEEVPHALTITDLRDDPTVEGVLVTGHDVSDRARALEDLREANAALAATLESTADGIMVVDHLGRLTSFNRRFVEMWMPGEAAPGRLDEAGVLWRMATKLRDPSQLVARSHHHDPVAGAASHDTLELLDGRIVERYSFPQLIGGRVSGRVWSFRDVSEHRRLAAELAHQAFHDALTGLANQALFRDRVGHALERLGRDGSRVAVLFIDLDDFKRVNDSLGHSAGDEMLVTVAARISSCLRAGDTASRLGGDEFAVLIDDVRDDGDAVALAERILEALRRPTAVGAGPVGTASSIGIAYGEPGMDVDELLRNADLAMYTAKAAGKNCCRVYERSMHDAAVARLDLETRLRGAADRGELLVDYQPVMDLRTGRIESMEALVRWLHPERGLLAPGAFVPFAEEGGLIGEIGSHVLATACAAATRWVEEFGDAAPSVSVNLSPRQLADEDLPERIEGLLSSVGLRPDRLTLEITEGELMRDPVGAGLSLERLSALGVRLAVDDFGTGYSALAYLRQFPVDVLKVDRSFLGRARDDDSWRLAHAIVQISHALGLVPVAEGVERADQVDVLRSFGCELGQGYHLARPMSADAATDAIRRSVAALGEGPRVRGPAPPRPSASGAAQTAGSR